MERPGNSALLPEWLIARWEKRFGAREAEDIARAALEEPRRYVRVPAGEPLSSSLESNPTDVAGCYELVSGPAHPMRLQDIGSQAIVPLLDLNAGQRYLDLCAAPGNKTMQALETQVWAVACDISGRRIREVPPVCPRVLLDATRPLPFSVKFDRVFIDAPCSGTGTLARNPEIKWRVQSEDLVRFQTRQTDILNRGLEQMNSRGETGLRHLLVGARGNQDVVRKAVRGRPEVRIIRETWRLPGREPGDGFYAAVLTFRDKRSSSDADRAAG